MLTEKQARAICEALGVRPNRYYPFTRVATDPESGETMVCCVTNWQAVQRTAEETADG